MGAGTISWGDRRSGIVDISYRDRSIWMKLDCVELDQAQVSGYVVGIDAGRSLGRSESIIEETPWRDVPTQPTSNETWAWMREFERGIP